MIEFRSVDDDAPVLVYSPLVRAVEKTLAYIEAHGGIGLTPAGAFKRVFVHWAAAQFEWPGYGEAELFAYNKVLNEYDFGPLEDIHGALIALKIGRHYKKQFRLTRAGRTLVSHPGRLFGIVTPFYLFEVDHLRFARTQEQLLGSWDIFLNVLNVEAENGASGRAIRNALYGEHPQEDLLGSILNNLYVQVLRPLCWAGLLHEDRVNLMRSEESVFTKTPLWHAALQLTTDRHVSPATRH